MIQCTVDPSLGTLAQRWVMIMLLQFELIIFFSAEYRQLLYVETCYVHTFV